MADGTTDVLTLAIPVVVVVFVVNEIVGGGVASVIVTDVLTISDDDEIKEGFEVAGVTSVVALTTHVVFVTGNVVLTDTVGSGAGVLTIILIILGT